MFFGFSGPDLVNLSLKVCLNQKRACAQIPKSFMCCRIGLFNLIQFEFTFSGLARCVGQIGLCL